MIDLVFEILGLYAQFFWIDTGNCWINYLVLEISEAFYAYFLILRKNFGSCFDFEENIYCLQNFLEPSSWESFFVENCSENWLVIVGLIVFAAALHMIVGIVNILKNWGLCWIKLETISDKHSFCTLKIWSHMSKTARI